MNDPDRFGGHPFPLESPASGAGFPDLGREPAPAAPSDPRAARRALRSWKLAAVPIVLGSLALACSTPLDGLGVLERLGWLASALGWALALHAARRVPPAARVWPWLLVGSLALRAPWVAAEPALSDDLERYVWEGGLVAWGVDVTHWAPDAPQLAFFRLRWPEVAERVAHREVPAAYPPLALLTHAAAVALAGGPAPPERARRALRLTYGLCDLGVLAALLWLLRRRGAAPALACAWGWCPWVALEFPGAGHLDALAILALVLALALGSGRRTGTRSDSWSDLVLGALLALGGLAKLLPAVLLPFALRGRRWGLGLAGAALVTVLVVGGYALQVGAWPRTAGLGQYALRWESFSLVFRGLEPLFGAAARDGSWTDPRRLARAAVGLAWLILALSAWRRRLEPARAAFWLVGGFLVLTPTLHPWYLSWIVPFLALFPSAAWSWLLIVSPLLYWPVAGWRAQRVWHEPGWLWPLVALPFLVLLAREGRRAWRAPAA